jgi:hypothetical protein
MTSLLGKIFATDAGVAVEPFDPETQLPIPSDRAFSARVILLGRDSFLMEDTVDAFSERYGFLSLAEGQDFGECRRHPVPRGGLCSGRRLQPNQALSQPDRMDRPRWGAAKQIAPLATGNRARPRRAR